MCVCVCVCRPLSFECDHQVLRLLLVCIKPQRAIQASQILANYTTDWILSVILSHMNVMMWSSRLNIFAHVAFNTRE